VVAFGLGLPSSGPLELGDEVTAPPDQLREPADMPWGERLAFVRDPEGNIVTPAMTAG